MTGVIRALDLCSGCGGWACAARGLPVSWACVADRAADCLETWALNHGGDHPGCVVLRCELSTEEGVAQVLDACRGGVDLVTGGIPCEQVSPARANRPLREGEMGALHRLIDGVWNILRALRPRWWVIEDVEGILPHLPPPLFGGLPYDVRKIDASLYGPQARERVFFGLYPEPAAPEPGPRVLGDVLRPGPYRTVADFGSRHERAALVGVERDPFSRERPAVPWEPARVVVAGHGDRSWHVEENGLVRVMEWQEAALLQGFPTDYVFAASWSRTWKLVAQAIPIQVGRAILRAIAAELEGKLP